MARANNNGWDFVKEGEIYQYKEDGYIAMIKILKDNSNEEFYDFELEIIKATMDIGQPEFNISHNKEISGYYSGMIQLYKHEDYMCEYTYFNNTNQ